MYRLQLTVLPDAYLDRILGNQPSPAISSIFNNYSLINESILIKHPDQIIWLIFWVDLAVEKAIKVIYFSFDQCFCYLVIRGNLYKFANKDLLGVKSSLSAPDLKNFLVNFNFEIWRTILLE